MSTEKEGVIKFQLEFDERPVGLDAKHLETLNQTRSQLIQAGMMGEDPHRYDGLGFGNISCRSTDQGDQFFITGTQTGRLSQLKLENIACVQSCHVAKNKLKAYGLSKPSSEAMTHGVLYLHHPDIGCVIHVHAPDIWHHSDGLDLPYTDQDIPYGTPQMAEAVNALAKQYYDETQPLVFVMKGHQDGVVAAGKDLRCCSQILLDIQTRARANIL